ncbi:MAG: hypothetical protein ACXADB_03440 [Candidatus Hermodarchaeia archaeon]
MAAKNLGHESQQLGQISQDKSESDPYHWVYVTNQEQDIEVQVTPTGHGHFTIDTQWYRAQIRTYDLLDTVVRFCQTMYGLGTLIVVLS